MAGSDGVDGSKYETGITGSEPPPMHAPIALTYCGRELVAERRGRRWRASYDGETVQDRFLHDALAAIIRNHDDVIRLTVEILERESRAQPGARIVPAAPAPTQLAARPEEGG